MVHNGWRLRWGLVSVFGLAVASVVIVSLLARGPHPAAPVPIVEASLEPFSPLELWAARGGSVRASAFRYFELDKSLARAMSELQAGQPDRALLSHLDTLARWGPHPQALAALGRFYMALRDRPKLRQVLASLSAVEPQFPPLRLLRAEELLLDGDRAAARRELESLRHAGYPVQGRARLLLATLEHEAGRTAQSRELVGSVSEEDLDLPDSREALRRLELNLVNPAD